jgi:hypothetical protein
MGQRWPRRQSAWSGRGSLSIQLCHPAGGQRVADASGRELDDQIGLIEQRLIVDLTLAAIANAGAGARTGGCRIRGGQRIDARPAELGLVAQLHTRGKFVLDASAHDIHVLIEPVIGEAEEVFAIGTQRLCGAFLGATGGKGFESTLSERLAISEKHLSRTQRGPSASTGDAMYPPVAAYRTITVGDFSAAAVSSDIPGTC